MIRVRYTIHGQYEVFEYVASYLTLERYIKGISQMMCVCNVIGIELIEEQE